MGKIFKQILSIILIQAFLVTGVVYPEPALRVPMKFGNVLCQFKINDTRFTIRGVADGGILQYLTGKILTEALNRSGIIFPEGNSLQGKEITLILANEYDSLERYFRESNFIILNRSVLEKMIDKKIIGAGNFFTKRANEGCFEEFLIKLVSEGLAHKRGAGVEHKERLMLMAAGFAILKYNNKETLDFYLTFLREFEQDARSESEYLTELEKVEFIKLPFGRKTKEIPVFQHIWRPADDNLKPWLKFASTGLVQALYGVKGDYGYVNGRIVTFENLNFGEPEVKRNDRVLVLKEDSGYYTVAAMELSGNTVETINIRDRGIINIRITTRITLGGQARVYKQESLDGLGKYDRIIMDASEPFETQGIPQEKMLAILKEIPDHLEEGGFALFRINLEEPEGIPLWDELFAKAGLEYGVILKYADPRWDNDNVMHFYTQAIVKIRPRNKNEVKVIPAVTTPKYTYQPGLPEVKEDIQKRIHDLNNKHGKWDYETAFYKMSVLQEEMLKIVKEINPSAAPGNILTLLRFSEHMRIFIELLKRLGDDERRETTCESLSIYWDPEKRNKLELAAYACNRMYRNIERNKTTIFDEIGKQDAIYLLIYFSQWDEKRNGGVFVNLLKAILDKDAVVSKKMAHRLDLLDNERVELVRWDLMNRFPGDEGLVLFHGAQDFKEAGFFLDKTNYLAKPTFFTDIPDYAERKEFVDKDNEGAVIISKVPFEKILYVTWLFTDKRLEEPEISIMPGPLNELGSVEIFYLSSEADMDSYSKFKDKYKKNRRRYYDNCGIRDTHQELYNAIVMADPGRIERNLRVMTGL